MHMMSTKELPLKPTFKKLRFLGRGVTLYLVLLICSNFPGGLGLANTYFSIAKPYSPILST